MHDYIQLLLSLIFIVVASSVFCNALEHLGEKLGVSAGVTGSIFAAIGTALPETIIPILAIYTANGNSVNNEIGVGAILGAPLMLSTLSVFVMALSVNTKRGFTGAIRPESGGLERDLLFFLASFMLAFICAIIPINSLSWFINPAIATLLVGSYFLYILLTVKSSAKLAKSGHGTVADEKLYLTFIRFKVNHITIILQLFLGLALLIYCADMFIDAVKSIAFANKFSPFLLSLIIIPIATELPEKINSLLWLRRGKDTQAMGNITGAMVFQGSLLPAIGILFANWHLESKIPAINIAITLFATLWIYFNLKRGGLKVWHFFINGLLYMLNIFILISLR
ncbi:MAG: sodium:proton exchanger [Burkholderiales bacterium]|jgi:cation:H+ antiporter|nr:sodium:proton exchanger [Burkholderiales bacterium]